MTIGSTFAQWPELIEVANRAKFDSLRPIGILVVESDLGDAALGF